MQLDRRYREMLVIPLTRDDYVDYDWTMKLTSDITPTMKLLVSGLVGKQYTMQHIIGPMPICVLLKLSPVSWKTGPPSYSVPAISAWPI